MFVSGVQGEVRVPIREGCMHYTKQSHALFLRQLDITSLGQILVYLTWFVLTHWSPAWPRSCVNICSVVMNLGGFPTQTSPDGCWDRTDSHKLG